MHEVRRLLRAARENLDMDVAFVSEFVDDKRFFRYVDAANDCRIINEGEGGARGTSFCQAVVDGRLPELVDDVTINPVARALSPRCSPVRSHISVPIRISDGTIYGTFCCFARHVKPSMNRRDVAMLRTFAEITADHVERNLQSERKQAVQERRIRSLIASGGPTMMYQPVFMLDDMRLAGAEALSRFPVDSTRSVTDWFREAAEVGLQVELELQAIENALRDYRDLWRSRPIQLGFNASPATIVDPRFRAALRGFPHQHLVLELTEHEEVQDYAALLEATRELRRSGTKLAIDDVGAGYASMRHVLTLRPDILKLDMSLVRSIDSDDLRLALVSSLKHFADRFDCKIVAEGVETVKELATLRRLGLQAAQGYLLSRPAPVSGLRSHLSAQDP